MNPERHAHIKQLFLGAVELSGEDRAAYLDQQCDDDAELRDEVLSLLRYHDTRTILADPTTTAGSKTGRGLPAGSGRREHRAARRSIRVGLAVSPSMAVAAIVIALVLALLGYWVHSGIKASLRQMRCDKLVALRDAQIMALQHWMDNHKSKVESWARDLSFVDVVEQLMQLDTGSDSARSQLLRAPQQEVIRDTLEAMVGHAPIYAIWDRTGVMIAADPSLQDRLGQRMPATAGSTLIRVLNGETVLRKPYEKNALVKDPVRSANEPLIAIVTPIRDDQDSVIGVLGIADSEAGDKFSEILAIARTGKTGETYAFDEHGTMLSESRFTVQLKQLRLIPDTADARSSLRVQIRDPRGDLTTGYRPQSPPAHWALTKMARLATARQDGVDLNGYRDYRGVKVIGAWRWLPDAQFGVATEIDFNEAYAPLKYLNVAFGILFGLLVVSVGTGFVFLFWIGRLTSKVGEALKLGQYTLEEKIGEGGIGIVYKARHAMLKRPTAVKLLKPEQVSDETLARFEREVQLASQLTHPNTIEIYDYGRTPEGVFYYAMEYLPGLSVAKLIEMEKTVPPSRAVYLLAQVCRSLREAHALGLVHRDIKPLNIMLCQRGGDYDVIKVLDFGLVKYVDTPVNSDITASGVLSGTPQYIAPERLTDPSCLDTRSDLYAFGAVGYKLLTGADVFSSHSNLELFNQVLNTPPAPPSARAETEIPPQLDRLIVDCLAKEPSQRPQNVGQVLEILEAVGKSIAWKQSDARAWWEANSERRHQLNR